MISNFDADRKENILIYIYLILIKILIQVRCAETIVTVTVNGLILTVKLMVNKLGRLTGNSSRRYLTILNLFAHTWSFRRFLKATGIPPGS